MIRRGMILLMGVSIFSAIVIAIIVSVKIYIDPQPLIHFPDDTKWLLFYTALVLCLISLVWIQKGRLLFIIVVLSICISIIVPSIFANNFPSFLILSWIILVATGIGDFILLRITSIQVSSLIERLIIDLVIGLGAIMFIILIMGGLNLYYSYLAFILMIGLSLYFLPLLYRSTRNELSRVCLQIKKAWQGSDLSFVAFILGSLAFCGLGAYIWALSPAIRYDAMSYHIAAPAIYIQQHGIVEIPESTQSYWTHYGEMLYTLGMLLKGQPLPGLLHFVASIIAAVLSYCLGRRIKGGRTGLIAAFIFFSLPIISLESGTAYIDLFVTDFILGMILTGVIWWQDQNIKWLLISGILAGFALGTKLTALPIVVPFIILLVFCLFLRYRKISPIIDNLLHFSLPAALLFAPWLFRDWIWTGNPIYPNYQWVFQGSKETVSGMFQVQKPNLDMIISFIRLPWDLVTKSITYYHEAPGGMLAALPLLGLPWFYTWHNLYSKKQIFENLAIFIFSMFSTIFLFMVSPNARYLIPIYPILSVLAALNIETIWISLNSYRKKKVILLLIFFLSGLYLFSTRLPLIVSYWQIPERYPYKVALGLESPEAFLSRSSPVYEAFLYLNKIGNKDTKVLSIGNELRLYTKVHIFGPLFSPETLNLLTSAKSPKDLALSLYQTGFQYLLLNPAEQQIRPEVYEPPALNNQFYEQYTQLIYAQNNVFIFKLFPDITNNTLETSPNLLTNAGFEELGIQGEPEDWSFFGSPAISQNAHSGKYALIVSGQNPPGKYSYAWQEVPVNPGQLYSVEYWAQGNSEVSLQLQINWLDRNHHLIKSNQNWRQLNLEWTEYHMSDTAPDQAQFAQIYVSVNGKNIGLIDDVNFQQGGIFP